MEVGSDEGYRKIVESAIVRVHVQSPETLTVVCDLGLQPRELVDSALGGARYELRPQLVAVDCPRLSVPIHSHVYQSTCEGGCGVLAGLRVGVDIAK